MLINCENLVKIYKVANLEVVALQGLELAIQEGEMMTLIGPSGSGKSTLMAVLGGLDTPSAGRIRVGDHDLTNMSRRDQIYYRRRTVGFVWQQTSRNLLPYLTARKNVEMPMTFDGIKSRERRQRAQRLLEQVGLSKYTNTNVSNLSGGEQQRVALAVAMANIPKLLLADEPTGELDGESSNEVFDVMRELNREYKTTVVIVTHDHNVASRVDRVVGMRDGRASIEVLRQQGTDGVSLTEEEFAVLDRAGRLQLPRTFVESLSMRNRVRLHLHEDHIRVYPDMRNK